jgi:hypothetical protein
LEEDYVIEYLNRAKERIRFVGPGMPVGAALTLASRWRRLGSKAVEIVLDVDSELCRIGFCDGEALRLLLEAASDMGGTLQWQSGIRLCILEIDDEQIIFAPTPRLVEEPRGISSQIEYSLSRGERLAEQIHAPASAGPKFLNEAIVDKVASDLAASPPLPFDLARQVRVLSTRFQFVEFSLQRAALSRKRVSVPPDLLGLGSDPVTEELLRANFKLVTSGDDISGEHLTARKEAIERKYLITILNYGNVIVRSNRNEFDLEVAALRREIEKFQESAETKLNEALERNCAEVIARLLPAVKASVPTRWRSRLGANPSDSEIRSRLEYDLKGAFGNARDHLSKIQVRLLFKDVTVEMLNDGSFEYEAHRANFDLRQFYEEFEAARSRD